MRTKFLAVAACGALMMCGSAALAQASGATGDAASGSTASSNFTDDQLKAFAGVAMQMQKNPGQDQATMAKQIQASGLTVQQFNDIATQMRNNPSLNAKIQSLASASPAPSSTTESPTASPAPGASSGSGASGAR